VRVAIDGSAAAGKTMLADELAISLRGRGRDVIRASIEGFLRPRIERYRRERTQSRSVRPVVFGSGRPFFASGGVAEPLRLQNPTMIVPGDRVTHLDYDVCTG
jgi:hypothetical protein